ncbi:hypothetical protein [Rubrobacter aplysinae]|uniref:hypothetical protein n=1 Tax=Rubrobacter aplysinae TaxID=909625 RepID=UPI00064C05FA|nr:hypothetical protein [Rubrobacter aplysinae]
MIGFREEMVWVLCSRRTGVRLGRSLLVSTGCLWRGAGGAYPETVLELDQQQTINEPAAYPQHLADLIAASWGTMGPILWRLGEGGFRR